MTASLFLSVCFPSALMPFSTEMAFRPAPIHALVSQARVIWNEEPGNE